jgi:RNA polymerase sigma factor (sigma-70 family)
VVVERDQADGREPRAGLDAALEARLVLASQLGDEDATRRLLAALEPFVRWLARMYRAAPVPEEDLVQEGTIGLLKAIKGFEVARNVRLATYARPWVEGEMRRLRERSAPIPLPAAKAQLLSRINRAEEELRARGEAATASAVAAAVGATEEDVLALGDLAHTVLELVPEAVPVEDGPLETLDSGHDATYTAGEVEHLLGQFAEHRGRLEGARPREQARTPSGGSGGLSPLAVRLVDVEAALERLPDAEHDALELVALHGLSPREAARWLGAHPNTVRNRCRRGVEAIVDHLNGVNSLPARPRARPGWSANLDAVESIRLVVRSYADHFERLAELAETNEWFARMEFGWVQMDGEWTLMMSHDILETFRRMGANVRLLSDAIPDE